MRWLLLTLLVASCTQMGTTPDCTTAQCGPDLDATIVDTGSSDSASDTAKDAADAGDDAPLDAPADAPKDSTTG